MSPFVLNLNIYTIFIHIYLAEKSGALILDDGIGETSLVLLLIFISSCFTVVEYAHIIQ